MTLLSIAVALSLGADPGCAPVAAQLQSAQGRLEGGELRQAQSLAEDAADSAPGCVDAHLMLVRALQARLEGAGRLSALGLSRRYRRAVADALEIDPDNIDARTAEIGYLIHAPGIAGGDRRRAADLIDELEALAARPGAEMRLELARAEGDDAALLSALAALIALDAGNDRLRSEYARRLIIDGAYDRAEAELTAWPDGDARREAERAYLRGALRVLGEFDLAAAESLLMRSIEIERDADASDRWPPRAGAWALLGSAREGLGDLEGARAAYGRAQDLEPDNRRAAEGLSRLTSP